MSEVRPRNQRLNRDRRRKARSEKGEFEQMISGLKPFLLGAVLAAAPGLLYGQFDFQVAGRDVQVHSFASQGFVY